MEVPTIDWPTAFVIAVAMICAAVLINKASDAVFGGDGGMIAAPHPRMAGARQTVMFYS